MKARYIVVSFVVLLAMLMASCQPPATPAPAGEQPSGETGDVGVCESAPNACAEYAPGETIKIGMGAPMTGDNAQFGIDISQGAMIAMTDGGDIEGWTFELVVEDDGGTPEGGAAVANKFVSDPDIVAIAGHIFSGATDSAMPIYERENIPMMSPSATNPPLTEQGSKVFNRVAFTDEAQGRYAAEYLFNTLGKTRIAVMHDGQAYGQGLADVVSEHFQELGGEVVIVQPITPGETDYTASLNDVAARDPEAVYYGGYVQDAVVLVNQMGQSGLTDVVFFGCDGTFGADFIDRTGSNGEGAFAVALIPPSSPERETFDAAYEEQFGATAGSLSPYTWNAYDSAASLIAAIKSVAFKGDNGNLYIPRTELVEAVRNLEGFQGLTGTITCDDVGECNSTGPTFYVVQNGEWVVVEN